MKKIFLISIVLINITTMIADTRLWQSDWYMGESDEICDSIWNCNYSRSESLNVENHMIVFMSNEIEPTNWYSHIMYDGTETGSHYQFPVYGDIDGDEHLDFIGLEAQQAVWYETDGDFDRWTRTLLHDFGGETGNGGNAKVHDIDRDGDNDIILGIEPGLFIFYNNDDGSFDLTVIDSSRFGYHEVEIADIDQDGMSDIVTAGLASYGSTGPMFFFRQEEGDTFSAHMIDSRSGHWRINVADFNGDGYPDIFNSGWDVQCFINDGDMTFTQTFEMGISSHTSESFDGSGIADFDKDGDIDFLAVTSSDSGLYVIYNDGTGHIDSSHSYSEYPSSYADACISGDVDLDGDYDVIGGNNDAGMGLADGPAFDFHTIGSITNSHHVEIFKRDYECGVMMHVLSRSNDGYYLFENRMLSFLSRGFLESSVLDLAYGMMPDKFGWIDCLPEGFEVDYSYRYGLTAEACTTMEFIPIEESGDDVDGICGGFFQYRIDFNRTTGSDDQSPRLDSVYLDVRDCGCFIDFDRMTFHQDTICDGVNNLQICYNIIPTCQDSSYNVGLLASSDGGETWDIPLETIVDTVGAFGESIRRDWYCFDWNLTEDVPGFAGDILFRPITIGEDIMAIVNTSDFPFYIDGHGPNAYASITPAIIRPLSSMTISIDSLRDRSGVIREECYMRISGCDLDDSISLALIEDGGIIHIDLPYIDCDSAMVIFCMTDSFCNYSEDTFYFDIQNQAPEINPCHTSLIGLFFGDTLERPISTIDESDSVDITVITEPNSDIVFDNHGFQWIASDTGFTSIYIIATDIPGLSDTCIMSVQVHSTGVYEEISSREKHPNIQIKPNPFQKKCFIHLDNISEGNIEIFNMLGQKIDDIYIHPNTDVIIWEPENQPNGTYLMKYKSGTISIDRELILTN